MSLFSIYEKYAVKDCASLDDFLNKYRKPERFKLRGEDYAVGIIESHKIELRKYGITWISNYESMTGQVVAYIP